MLHRFHSALRVASLLTAVWLGFGCTPSTPQTDPSEASDPPLPGVARVDQSLRQELDQLRLAMGDDYEPRTHHLDADGTPKFTNRLIRESSPYLVQHAHNPVNWYPWSAEAFERAKRENKPIFLSVGYSTCHWCHVMERESFEDEEIAAFLNEHFIAIKVDREERPDVDSVYMTAVQLLSGRGGWPMTVILTPDKDPFFGGTYFPPRAGARGARLGLTEVLEETRRIYSEEPTRALEHAQQLSQRIAEVTTTYAGKGVPSDATIHSAVGALARSFDPVDGGFGAAPKFPQPARLGLLLRYARRTGDPIALEMVTMTLDRMADGGIYDHVGGGFHRYSTDGVWLVPHFEKMLYDNAQLARVYLDAWQATGRDRYQRVAREILDYVAREMTAPEGGFYSATDADSPTPSGHDEEGWFFTWTPSEIEGVLGSQSAAIVGMAYGVSKSGNFEGRSILHRAKSDRAVARALGVSADEVASVLDDARTALYRHRLSRPPPIRDDKIIAAWNGLMISAFAQGAWALGEPRYSQIAADAGRFVLEHMRSADGALVRTSTNGKTSSAAFLDDYAFMVAACLDLYEATAELSWLEHAIALQRAQHESFVDSREGGYFMTAAGTEALLVREKPSNDSAVPSGNSIAALNLLRLHDFTTDIAWRESAEALFSALGPRVERAPIAYPELLSALDHYYDVPMEVALIAPDEPSQVNPLAAPLRTSFVPNKAFLASTAAVASAQQTVVPWLEGKQAMAGRPTAYVCERGRCELPTSSARTFAQQISKKNPYPSFPEGDPPPALQLRSTQPPAKPVSR